MMGEQKRLEWLYCESEISEIQNETTELLRKLSKKEEWIIRPKE